MKKITYLIVLALIISSCNKKAETQQLETKIQITLTGSTAKTLEIVRPLNGILLFGQKVDTINKGEDGKFSFNFNVDKPEYVNYRIGNRFKKLILLPNQGYSIGFNDSTEVYSQDNAQGQRLYNSFSRPPVQSFTFINKFNKDTTAQQLANKIKSLQTGENKQANDLLASNEIDELFHDMLIKDINYYYASGIVSISDYRSITANEKEIKDYQLLINKTIDEYPYEISSPPISWSGYVMDAQIRRNMYGGLSPEIITDLYKKDSLHILATNRIKSKVDKPYEESILAHYIYDNARQKRYEKSLITVFDDFKKEYPKSEFLSYLEEDIISIKEYHKKIKQDIPNNVTVIEDANVNSLLELLPKFRGEKIYIDMWATWCGPCKKEFEHNNAVNKVLEKNNYKKLYISLDKAKDRNKWMELIKFYDLEGYHHLASQEFFIDFEKNHSTIENAVSIPQYLIVNEAGKIITNDAARPSESKKLEEFLKGL